MPILPILPRLPILPKTPTLRKTPILAAVLLLGTVAAVRAQNPFAPQMKRVPGPVEHVLWATRGEAGVGFGTIVLGKPLPKTLPPAAQESTVFRWGSYAKERKRRSLSEPWRRGENYRNALDIVTRTDKKGTFVVEAIRLAAFSVPGGWQEPSISGYEVAERRAAPSPSRQEPPRLPRVARVGDSEREILQAFPGAKRAAHYFCRERRARIDVYDDRVQGVAFEIQAWQGAGKGSKPPRLCSGIIIHRRGQPVSPVGLFDSLDWKAAPKVAPPV